MIKIICGYKKALTVNLYEYILKTNKSSSVLFSPVHLSPDPISLIFWEVGSLCSGNKSTWLAGSVGK